MKKGAKRYDGIWGIMREMSKGIKTGDCVMDSEPFNLPGSSCKSWEEFNRLIEPMFAVNEKKPAVIWCVENGPFHKYIKKLRRQRRKEERWETQATNAQAGIATGLISGAGCL